VAGDLHGRLAGVGRRLGEREAAHRQARQQAAARAAELREQVAHGLAGYHEAIGAVQAGHLAVELGALRTDEKHARAVEFDLRRGRHRAIVTVKSRGEVTLVGPFRSGKNEGPCQSFPCDAGAALQEALGNFLEQFLEAAATP